MKRGRKGAQWQEGSGRNLTSREWLKKMSLKNSLFKWRRTDEQQSSK